MDQVQESYDEFNLNFRIEDTVIVNQTEMEGFNAFFLGNQSTCQQSVVEACVFCLTRFLQRCRSVSS